MARRTHYIARSILNGWSFRDANNHRRVRVYSFRDDAFSSPTTKGLFAPPELYEPDVEQRLADLVETPLGEIRDRLLSETRGHTLTPTELEQRHFRALALTIALQAQRSAVALLGADQEEFAAVLRMTDVELDELVYYMQHRWRLVTIRLGGRYEFHLPGSGIVVTPSPAFPGIFKGEYPFGYGVPLTPQLLMAFMPRGASQEKLMEWIREKPLMFCLLSVGFPSDMSRLVVIPPSLHQLSDSQVREHLLQSQATATGVARSLIEVGRKFAQGRHSPATRPSRR